MEVATPVPSKSEETKQLLLKAATSAFAYDGYHGASLKKIARTAGVNPALIAYHFGNKEGLYLATFEALVAQIETRIGPMEEKVRSMLSNDVPAGAGDPESLKQMLFSIVDGMVDLLSSEESREWALLITREQTTPTEAFEVLYHRFMGKFLGLVTRLIQRIKPAVSENEARLFVVLIVGQILVFRVSKTAVLRHMAWERYGDEERASAKAQLHRSIAAWLAEGA